MPLPIAHPAAVLPLRRYCPKYLSLSALIIGSVAPDIAYFIDDLNKFSHTVTFLFGSSVAQLQCVRENWDWDDLSHTFAGGLLFGLPLGLLVLGLFFRLRVALIETLPDPHRSALRPLCGHKHSIWVQLTSLLIGISLHNAWDSFTNGDRWLAQHWPLLHAQLLTIGTTQFEVYRVLWIISSLGGTAVLIVAYSRFLKRAKTSSSTSSENNWPRYLLWSAALLLPVVVAVFPTIMEAPFGTTRHALFAFFHRFIGYYLVCFVVGLFFISLFSKLRLIRSNRKA